MTVKWFWYSRNNSIHWNIKVTIKNNKHDETDKEHKIEKHATGRGLANRNNTESPDP